jgi:hypothetical protein
MMLWKKGQQCNQSTNKERSRRLDEQQLMTKRRELLLKILKIKYHHIGKYSFEILIFDSDLIFGGLGEPRSAH